MAEPHDPLWTPPDEGGEDDDAIEVRLDLIGEGSLRAIEALTQALTRFEALMTMQATTDPRRRQAASQQVAEPDHASRVHPVFGAPGEQGALFGTGANYEPPERLQIPQTTGMAEPGQYEAGRRAYAAPPAAAIPDEPQAGERPPAGTPARTPPPPEDPRSPFEIAQQAAEQAKRREDLEQDHISFASEWEGPQRDLDREDERDLHRINSNAFEEARRAALDAEDEEDIEAINAYEPEAPPRRRLDRTLQMARGGIERLHQNPLHNALAMAGNVAMLRAIGGSELEGEGGGGGGGFFSSMTGSMMANALSGRGEGGTLPEEEPSRLTHMLRIASESAGLLGAGYLAGQRANRFVSGVTQPGVRAGYEPGAVVNIPGTDIGFRTPFEQGQGFLGLRGGGLGVPFLPHLAPATREEIDRRIDQFRLRLQGGITGDQAREITQGLWGEGFTGNDMERTAFDAIAPLVRQGQNPQLAVGMTVQAIRNGNASLQEVVDTMGNLGPAARAARMSLDEFQQGLDQFAEQAESAGAYRNQGVQLGRGLSEVTGLTPQQLGPIMGSPLFQAMAFQHQGVMPNAVGSLTTRQFTQETGRLVDFAMRAARPFGSRVGPTGERLSPERARQNQIIQAAQFAGMDVETFTRLLDNRGRLDNLAAGHEAVTDFQAILRQRDETMHNLPPEQRAENRQNTGTAGQTLTPEQERMNQRRQAQVDRLNTLTNRGWQRVEHALTGAAPGKPGDKSDQDRVEYFRRVRDIENIRDPRQRLTEAQKLLDEQAKQSLKEDQPAVRLDLSPEAKRLVRQMGGSNDPAKDEAQRGGEQVNKDRTKPGKQFAPFHWNG